MCHPDDQQEVEIDLHSLTDRLFHDRSIFYCSKARTGCGRQAEGRPMSARESTGG